MENTAIDITNAAPAAMDITLDRAALLPALDLLCKVIESRNSFPILANVAIVALVDGIVELRGTDLDMQATIRLPGRVSQLGTATVAAKLLHGLVKQMDGESIALCCDGERIKVSNGRAVMSLPTLDISEFPALAVGELPHVFFLNAAQLAADIALIQPSISTEETRYYLNGIFMTGNDPAGLTMVATDGHRMHRVIRPIPEGYTSPHREDKSLEATPDVIMPRKAVGIIGKLCAKATGDVSVEMSASKMRFTVGGVEIVTKMIDGTFPDYTRVVPLYNDKVLHICSHLFGDAVKRVAAMASGKVRSIRLNIDAGRVKASIVCPENGVASEECPAQFSDADGFEIGFNAKYLADLLTVQPRAKGKAVYDATVKIWMADAAAPSRFVYDDLPHFDAVLMPMRVGCSDAPVSKPYVAPESAGDRFAREYTAGWEARDRVAMMDAIATYRAAQPEYMAQTVTFDIRGNCASIRGDDKASARVVLQRRASYASDGYGFKHGIGEVERRYEAAARRANWLGELPGYHAADPRALLPIRISALGFPEKAYVYAHHIQPGVAELPIYKRNGHPIGKKIRGRNGLVRQLEINVLYISAVLPGVNAKERKAIAEAIELASMAVHVESLDECLTDVADDVAAVELEQFADDAICPVEAPQEILATPAPEDALSALTARVAAIELTLSGKGETPVSVQPVTRERSPAHVRAIMAYLRVRKSRNYFRAAMHDEILIAAQVTADMFKMRDKRRRAVLTAVDLRRSYRNERAARGSAERRAQHFAETVKLLGQSQPVAVEPIADTPKPVFYIDPAAARRMQREVA